MKSQPSSFSRHFTYYFSFSLARKVQVQVQHVMYVYTLSIPVAVTVGLHPPSPIGNLEALIHPSSTRQAKPTDTTGWIVFRAENLNTLIPGFSDTISEM
jgi:hypothetical protein